jgi:tetratricopeptide (TPR) repeat protein
LIRRRAALLTPILVAILLHLPAVAHEFVFDDRGAILENPLLGRAADLPKIFVAPWWNAARAGPGLYRPITTLSFGIDRALAGGLRPGWFHLVNVLLHGGVTWLVARLALLLLESPTGACIAGLLFAVHPVHVEAVAGVVGRAEILAAGLTLAAVLLHRAALIGAGRMADLALAGAPVAILLAMLSKESAFTAPVLVAICDDWAGGGPTSGRRRRGLYASYAAAVLCALALRTQVLGSPAGLGAIPFIDNPAAAAGAVEGRLTALACVSRYAGLLLWPARLSVDYSYDQIPLASGASDPLVLLGFTLVAGIVVGGVLLVRRRQVAGRALLFTACSMALTANLLLFIGTLFAERLLYLPSVGACLLAGWAVSRMRAPFAARAALAVAFAAVVAAGVRTWVRLPEWRDDFTLYQSAARVSPRSARIRYNLGNAWLKRQDDRRAEEEYRAAIAIYPGFGDARANLGMTLLRLGRSADALEALTEAARLQPANAEVAVNLGSACRALGDVARAEREFRQAIAINPHAATAWNNLGSLALSRGDPAGAVDALQRAVAADPGFAIYHVNLADALMASNRKEEAIPEFERAATLDPELPEVRRGLGEIAMARSDLATAEREFRRAADASQPSARAANFLGYLLSRRGDARGAAAYYERALALDPTLSDAHRSLGLIDSSVLGEPGKALGHFRQSLALAPDQPGADDLRKWIRDLERRGG